MVNLLTLVGITQESHDFSRERFNKSTVNDLQIEVRDALVNANTEIDTSLQAMEDKINNKFDILDIN